MSSPQNGSGSDTPKKTALLALGALGVVFGDIGTSPLYALKEAFTGEHGTAISQFTMFGVLSLMFWVLTLIVSVKYILIVLNADNKGEGGDFALLAQNLRLAQNNRIATMVITFLGLLGGCLFYADALITPAISVLSAVEGIEVATPHLSNYVIPISLVILIGLFMVQRHGTASVAALFGPICAVWFTTIGLLGLSSIIQTPAILNAINPYHAVAFFSLMPAPAFLTLGAVVLVVTGAEALYADMGHFGKGPIRLSWFSVVWPGLVLNYLGQGALLLREPASVANPFYLLAPEWFLIPLVILATAATTIASQATISGAFSLTRQAIQLGFLPRMRILHTSHSEKGQIYIPIINWIMMALVILVVLGFRESSNLAAAYGIAVTGAMFVTSFAIAFVMLRKWRVPLWIILPVAGLFIVIEGSLLAANIPKIASGGWLPILVAIVLFTLLTTWRKGQAILNQTMNERLMPVKTFIDSLTKLTIARVPGTGVYLTSRRHVIPDSLVQNLKHNKVLHERVILMTVQTTDEPTADEENRVEIQDLGQNFLRVMVRFGFMEEPNLQRVLSMCAIQGLDIDCDHTSFFMGQETVLPTVGGGMALWREHLYALMKRNSGSAAGFYNVPADKVLEIHGRFEI